MNSRLKSRIAWLVSIAVVVLFAVVLSGAYIAIHRVPQTMQAFSCASVVGDAICAYISKNGRPPNSWGDIESQIHSEGISYGPTDIVVIEKVVAVDFEGLQNLSCNTGEASKSFIAPASDRTLAKEGIDSINNHIWECYRRKVCGYAVP